MAFSDLNIKIASEAAVIGLQPHMARLDAFAHNFSPASGVHYQGIQIPVYALSAAAEFDEETNNWCAGENEVDGQILTLDNHLIKSISITDIENGNVDINFLRDGARAIADVIGHGANKTVFGMFNATNCPISAEAPSTKEGFAGLVKVAADNNVNPYECTLVLNPETYSTLLGKLDYAVVGTSEAIKYGVIPELYGFRTVQMSQYLPEGVKGLIIPYGTVGIASRLNRPAIDGYVATWEAGTPDGFTIGFRVFEHLCKGRMYMGADVLFGAKILQPGIVRLV